ncbi:MAG: alpha/beta fold hydrolase [Promethearchaeota archaeon]
MQNIIFIHGLESSGNGFKGRLLQKWLPSCLTPDFEKFNSKISLKKLLEIRMEKLYSILNKKTPWIIIGSSFGGLMATIYTYQNREKISKLVLLAPYLSNHNLNPKVYSKVDIPVIIYHGKRDKIVPLNYSRIYAESIFTNLKYNIVDDDHSLHNTVLTLDWNNLIKI